MIASWPSSGVDALKLYGVDENIFSTHWGRVTHLRVNELTIIGSDYGRRQAIFLTNVGISLMNIVNWTLMNTI